MKRAIVLFPDADVPVIKMLWLSMIGVTLLSQVGKCFLDVKGSIAWHGCDFPDRHLAIEVQVDHIRMRETFLAICGWILPKAVKTSVETTVKDGSASKGRSATTRENRVILPDDQAVPSMLARYRAMMGLQERVHVLEVSRGWQDYPSCIVLIDEDLPSLLDLPRIELEPLVIVSFKCTERQRYELDARIVLVSQIDDPIKKCFDTGHVLAGKHAIDLHGSVGFDKTNHVSDDPGMNLYAWRPERVQSSRVAIEGDLNDE